MAYGLQMIAHNDHQPSIGRNQIVKDLPISAYTGAPNCFTVSIHGVSNGIEVCRDGVFDAAIMLGDRNNGGWGRFLKLNPDHMPKIYDGRLMGASLKRIERDGKPPIVLITSAMNTETIFFVKVETGVRTIVRSKAPQQIIGSNPEQLVDRGTFQSRLGFTASVEELWQMKDGESINIVFADGSVKTLRRLGKELKLEQNSKLREKLKVEVENAEWNGLMELVETEGFDDRAIKRRDAGYHQLMTWAGKLEERWTRLFGLMKRNIRDIRPVVGERFMSECPFAAFQIEFVRAYRSLPVQKTAALELPRVALPLLPVSPEQAAERLEKKKKKEQQRHERRARDKAEADERMKRPRPGEAHDQYGKGRKQDKK